MAGSTMLVIAGAGELVLGLGDAGKVHLAFGVVWLILGVASLLKFWRVPAE